MVIFGLLMFLEIVGWAEKLEDWIRIALMAGGMAELAASAAHKNRR